MSEWDKLEFADALSVRFMQLTVLVNATNEDPSREEAEQELHLLRTVILDLPKDILDLVRQRISL